MIFTYIKDKFIRLLSSIKYSYYSFYTSEINGNCQLCGDYGWINNLGFSGEESVPCSYCNRDRNIK